MGVIFRHRGSFKNLERFLHGYNKDKLVAILNKYGSDGVRALSDATPIDTGITASSWSYIVSTHGSSFVISFTNSNLTTGGTPLAILIQYGHGTKNGGYVEGRDFINPAIRPVFDNMADAVWQEVSKL